MAKTIFDGVLRHTYHPILFNDLHTYSKQLQATKWLAEEVSLIEDKAAFDSLNDNERKFILNTLAFFASSDGVVNENLCLNIMPHLTSQEAMAYYAGQMFIESIHNEMYSLLIDTYCNNAVEKDNLLNADRSIPCVKKKLDWAKKYIKEADLATQIAAFALVEGLFFSASFCSIYWLDYRKVKMPGLIKANKFISRDEALHAEVACHVYNKYCNKISNSVLKSMIEESCEIEKEFASEGLPVNLIGMNKELMCQYIEYVADTMAIKFNLSPIYNSTNPFDFLVKLALQTNVNFFEASNDQYNMALSNKGIDLNSPF